MIEGAVKILEQYGLLGALLIVIFLLIQDAERIPKIEAYILKPTFRLFRWFPRRFIASKVASVSTGFITTHLSKFVESANNLKVRIKWVVSATDPILDQDGTVIIRLREEDDQTRNVLVATQAVLPYVACPSIRKNIDKSIEEAIDLTLLRKLADDIGNHAFPVFDKHFLQREDIDKKMVVDLFAKLVVLDKKGVFVSIFLHELDVLGAKMRADGKEEDLSEAVVSLLEFLLRIASRKVGEENDLLHCNGFFNVGIILLAKSSRMNADGLGPYLRRVQINILEGCKTIYLISYPLSFGLMKQMHEHVSDSLQLSIGKIRRLKALGKTEEGSKESHIEIARIDVSGSYKEREHDKLESLGLEAGTLVDAIVIDVAKEQIVVDLNGIISIVPKKHLAWNYHLDCGDTVEEGKTYQFIVDDIDLDRGKLFLSRKFPYSDPWKISTLPEENDTVTVSVIGAVGHDLIGRYNDTIDIIIPDECIPWPAINYSELNDLFGESLEVIITNIDSDERKVIASVPLTDDVNWEEAFKNLTPGKLFRATVEDITVNGVKVRLDNGLIGYIPKEAMIKAGFEYVDYQSNLVAGQVLDVVISKVNRKNQRITLNLQRNLRINSA